MFSTKGYLDDYMYEGWYQVSDKGRIRSVDRDIKQQSRYGHTVIRRIKGKIITPTDNEHGYLIAGLTKNQIRNNHYVHRLVAEAFIENEKHLETVNHVLVGVFRYRSVRYSQG